MIVSYRKRSSPELESADSEAFQGRRKNRHGNGNESRRKSKSSFSSFLQNLFRSSTTSNPEPQKSRNRNSAALERAAETQNRNSAALEWVTENRHQNSMAALERGAENGHRDCTVEKGNRNTAALDRAAVTDSALTSSSSSSESVNTILSTHSFSFVSAKKWKGRRGKRIPISEDESGLSSKPPRSSPRSPAVNVPGPSGIRPQRKFGTLTRIGLRIGLKSKYNLQSCESLPRAGLDTMTRDPNSNTLMLKKRRAPLPPAQSICDLPGPSTSGQAERHRRCLSESNAGSDTDTGSLRSRIHVRGKRRAPVPPNPFGDPDAREEPVRRCLNPFEEDEELEPESQIAGSAANRAGPLLLNAEGNASKAGPSPKNTGSAASKAGPFPKNTGSAASKAGPSWTAATGASEAGHSLKNAGNTYFKAGPSSQNAESAFCKAGSSRQNSVPEPVQTELRAVENAMTTLQAHEKKINDEVRVQLALLKKEAEQPTLGSAHTEQNQTGTFLYAKAGAKAPEEPQPPSWSKPAPRPWYKRSSSKSPRSSKPLTLLAKISDLDREAVRIIAENRRRSAEKAYNETAKELITMFSRAFTPPEPESPVITETIEAVPESAQKQAPSDEQKKYAIVQPQAQQAKPRTEQPAPDSAKSPNVPYSRNASRHFFGSTEIEEWVCPRCTLQNAHWRALCDACYFRKDSMEQFPTRSETLTPARLVPLTPVPPKPVQEVKPAEPAVLPPCQNFLSQLPLKDNLAKEEKLIGMKLFDDPEIEPLDIEKLRQARVAFFGRNGPKEEDYKPNNLNPSSAASWSSAKPNAERSTNVFEEDEYDTIDMDAVTRLHQQLNPNVSGSGPGSWKPLQVHRFRPMLESILEFRDTSGHIYENWEFKLRDGTFVETAQAEIKEQIRFFDSFNPQYDSDDFASESEAIMGDRGRSGPELSLEEYRRLGAIPKYFHNGPPQGQSRENRRGRASELQNDTFEISKLLRKLELAISRGDHKLAASLAHDLALQKVNCSVAKNDRPITIRVYVEDRLMQQGPFLVQVAPSMKVKGLKAKIECDWGIPATFQKWILGRKMAEDDEQALSAYEVVNDSMGFLYLVTPDFDGGNSKQDLSSSIAQQIRNPESKVRANSANGPATSESSRAVQISQKALKPFPGKQRCESPKSSKVSEPKPLITSKAPELPGKNVGNPERVRLVNGATGFSLANMTVQNAVQKEAEWVPSAPPQSAEPSPSSSFSGSLTKDVPTAKPRNSRKFVEKVNQSTETTGPLFEAQLKPPTVTARPIAVIPKPTAVVTKPPIKTESVQEKKEVNRVQSESPILFQRNAVKAISVPTKQIQNSNSAVSKTVDVASIHEPASASNTSPKLNSESPLKSTNAYSNSFSEVRQSSANIVKSNVPIAAPQRIISEPSAKSSNLQSNMVSEVGLKITEAEVLPDLSKAMIPESLGTNVKGYKVPASQQAFQAPQTVKPESPVRAVNLKTANVPETKLTNTKVEVNVSAVPVKALSPEAANRVSQQAAQIPKKQNSDPTVKVSNSKPEPLPKAIDSKVSPKAPSPEINLNIVKPPNTGQSSNIIKALNLGAMPSNGGVPKPGVPQQGLTSAPTSSCLQNNLIPNVQSLVVTGTRVQSVLISEARRKSLGDQLLSSKSPFARHELHPGNLDKRIQKFEALHSGGTGKELPKPIGAEYKRSLLTRKNSDGANINLEVTIDAVRREPRPDRDKILNKDVQGASSRLPAPESKEGNVQTYLDMLHMMETEDLIRTLEEVDCPVCFSRQPGITLRDCLHSFCRDCLIGAVRYADEPQVKCPFRDNDYSCDSVLQEREIKALVPNDVFEKHLAQSVKLAESKMANAYHCKTNDCPGWCVFEDDVNVFKCPVCSKRNCLTCQAIHENKNCQEYQRELAIAAETDEDAKSSRLMLEKMIQRGEALECPACHVVLLKKWGCDFVKCTYCKTEICWVTKGFRWGPNGKGDTSGGCKCGVNGVRCHPKCTYCH